MKKPVWESVIYLCLIVLLWNVSVVQADTTKKLFSETVTLNIEVQNYVEARAKLMVLIEENNGIIVSSDEYMRTPDKRGHFEIHFLDSKCQAIADGIEKLGYVIQRSVALRNDEEEYARQQEKLKEVQQRKESLTRLLSLAEEKEQYSVVLAVFDKLESEIANINIRMRDMENNNAYDRLKVDLMEPHLEPVVSGEVPIVGWVNMPGGEYIHLNIENNQEGETAQAYQGGAIKYLFYRQKAYGILGLLKATDSKDTVHISEIFIYGFGFDFYPRYMGRGKRRFLNLYHGFLVGGTYNSADGSIFHLSPHLGIEIVKTRHIIFDVCLGYFVPFTLNKKYRGPLMSWSFNFLF